MSLCYGLLLHRYKGCCYRDEVFFMERKGASITGRKLAKICRLLAIKSGAIPDGKFKNFYVAENRKWRTGFQPFFNGGESWMPVVFASGRFGGIAAAHDILKDAGRHPPCSYTDNPDSVDKMHHLLAFEAVRVLLVPVITGDSALREMVSQLWAWRTTMVSYVHLSSAESRLSGFPVHDG
ncbi:hypothetical protein CPB86DRAFT_797742 [Serendipita vermifera]|nr:hypothetical protein CPB86DRAFT_797742 [Serendipita vermifera]